MHDEQRDSNRRNPRRRRLLRACHWRATRLPVRHLLLPCDGRDANCVNACNRGELALECEGAEAETFHAGGSAIKSAPYSARLSATASLAATSSCVRALTYAREYPDGSQAKAGCVQRVREPAAPCASFAASFEVQHERHSAPHPP